MSTLATTLPEHRSFTKDTAPNFDGSALMQPWKYCDCSIRVIDCSTRVCRFFRSLIEQSSNWLIGGQPLLYGITRLRIDRYRWQLTNQVQPCHSFVQALNAVLSHVIYLGYIWIIFFVDETCLTRQKVTRITQIVWVIWPTVHFQRCCETNSTHMKCSIAVNNTALYMANIGHW